MPCSPQRERRLDHAPDVHLDEGERSGRQIAALLIGDIADLGSDGLRYVSRPAFIGIDRDDA